MCLPLKSSSTLRSSSSTLARNSSSSRANAIAEIGVVLGEQHGIGHDVAHAANVEPLLREVRHERRRARVGEHALDLLLDDARVAELAALGQRQQLVVGHAAPEEERQARRESVLIDGVNRTRRRIVGRRGEAIQEFRAREHDHQRVAHAGLETAGGTPGLVELERNTEIRVASRAAERPRA